MLFAPTRRRELAQNIANFRRQLKILGFSYDWQRELATTDTEYFRWTQYIFLVLFDTWFDEDCKWTDATGRPQHGKGRPISELPIPETVKAAGDEPVGTAIKIRIGWPISTKRR